MSGSKWNGEEGGPGWTWDCGREEKKCGCPYDSFWKTVIESPQWIAWSSHFDGYHNWDVSECEACGWISKNHFQAFLKFVAKMGE